MNIIKRTPTCPTCHMGFLERQTTTFAAAYRGTILSAPRIACARCDICGYIEYDDSEMTKLEMLLGIQPEGEDEARPSGRALAADGESLAMLNERRSGKRAPRMKP
jgi:hypothetical protein